MGVDEGHHLVFSLGIFGFGEVVEGGFVAVVAVGDEYVFVSHDLLYSLNLLRVGYRVKAVNHTIIIRMFKQLRGLRGLTEDGIDVFFGVAVEHEDLADLGGGGSGEVESVGFGAFEGVFVGFDVSAVTL